MTNAGMSSMCSARRKRGNGSCLWCSSARWLKAGGVRIRTAEDAEREEQFLFDSALSRATVSLVMSYPKNDARGEQNLRSLFLDPAESAIPSRPALPETAGRL